MPDIDIQTNKSKECPFCAELIKKAAIKCKHCGSMLSQPAPIATSFKQAVLPPTAEHKGFEQNSRVNRSSPLSGKKQRLCTTWLLSICIAIALIAGCIAIYFFFVQRQSGREQTIPTTSVTTATQSTHRNFGMTPKQFRERFNQSAHDVLFHSLKYAIDDSLPVDPHDKTFGEYLGSGTNLEILGRVDGTGKIDHLQISIKAENNVSPTKEEFDQWLSNSLTLISIVDPSLSEKEAKDIFALLLKDDNKPPFKNTIFRDGIHYSGSDYTKDGLIILMEPE